MVSCSAPAAEPSNPLPLEASTAPESSAPAEESLKPVQKDMTIHLAISHTSTADIWNDYSQKAFSMPRRRLTVNVGKVALDSKNSVEESVKAMESLIQQEVDGISIFPISIEQGAQLVKMANDAKDSCND